MTNYFDILVLGGGPAGYSSAIHAARRLKPHGGTVGLVEADELGGTCLNRGCIPTKTLIETAGFFDLFAEAPKRGIVLTGTASPDLPKVFQYKNRVVRKMTAGIGMLLRENGIEKIDGLASLARTGGDDFPFSVTVSTAGERTEIPAKKIILATGSVPTKVSIPGIADPDVAPLVLDSDDLLDADRLGLPERLAILGGGVIGLEMARIFRAFGSEVHLIEALPRLAPFLDTEVSLVLTKVLTSKKIKVSTGKTLNRIGRAGSGLLLHLDDGGTVEASHLLVAVGRSPKTDMLSGELREAIRLDRRGFVPVDWTMKTAVPGLYAPGDVNGKCMLAHAALEMGRLAADGAAEELYPDAGNEGNGEKIESLLEEYRRRIMEKDENTLLPSLTDGFFPFYIPGCIYGEPEVGFIGWTEEEARKRLGDKIEIGRFPFAANGRAASAGHPGGFVKVIRLRDKPAIVGVHIVGPCASELINEVSAVLYAGGNVEQWAASVHAHPTYGEALVEAAADSLGLALHLPPQKPAAE